MIAFDNLKLDTARVVDRLFTLTSTGRERVFLDRPRPGFLFRPSTNANIIQAASLQTDGFELSFERFPDVTPLRRLAIDALPDLHIVNGS